MITRLDIINELKNLTHLTGVAKEMEIEAFLRSKNVPDEEIDKILSDLVSYEEY